MFNNREKIDVTLANKLPGYSTPQRKNQIQFEYKNPDTDPNLLKEGNKGLNGSIDNSKIRSRSRKIFPIGNQTEQREISSFNPPPFSFESYNSRQDPNDRRYIEQPHIVINPQRIAGRNGAIEQQNIIRAGVRRNLFGAEGNVERPNINIPQEQVTFKQFIHDSINAVNNDKLKKTLGDITKNSTYDVALNAFIQTNYYTINDKVLNNSRNQMQLQMFLLAIAFAQGSLDDEELRGYKNLFIQQTTGAGKTHAIVNIAKVLEARLPDVASKISFYTEVDAARKQHIKEYKNNYQFIKGKDVKRALQASSARGNKLLTFDELNKFEKASQNIFEMGTITNTQLQDCAVLFNRPDGCNIHSMNNNRLDEAFKACGITGLHGLVLGEVFGMLKQIFTGNQTATEIQTILKEYESKGVFLRNCKPSEALCDLIDKFAKFTNPQQEADKMLQEACMDLYKRRGPQNIYQLETIRKTSATSKTNDFSFWNEYLVNNEEEKKKGINNQLKNAKELVFWQFLQGKLLTEEHFLSSDRFIIENSNEKQNFKAFQDELYKIRNSQELSQFVAKNPDMALILFNFTYNNQDKQFGPLAHRQIVKKTLEDVKKDQIHSQFEAYRSYKFIAQMQLADKEYLMKHGKNIFDILSASLHENHTATLNKIIKAKLGGDEEGKKLVNKYVIFHDENSLDHTKNKIISDEFVDKGKLMSSVGDKTIIECSARGLPNKCFNTVEEKGKKRIDGIISFQNYDMNKNYKLTIVHDNTKQSYYNSLKVSSEGLKGGIDFASDSIDTAIIDANWKPYVASSQRIVPGGVVLGKKNKAYADRQNIIYIQEILDNKYGLEKLKALQDLIPGRNLSATNYVEKLIEKAKTDTVCNDYLINIPGNNNITRGYDNFKVKSLVIDWKQFQPLNEPNVENLMQMLGRLRKEPGSEGENLINLVNCKDEQEYQKAVDLINTLFYKKEKTILRLAEQFDIIDFRQKHGEDTAVHYYVLNQLKAIHYNLTTDRKENDNEYLDIEYKNTQEATYGKLLKLYNLYYNYSQYLDTEEEQAFRTYITKNGELSLNIYPNIQQLHDIDAKTLPEQEIIKKLKYALESREKIIASERKREEERVREEEVRARQESLEAERRRQERIIQASNVEYTKLYHLNQQLNVENQALRAEIERLNNEIKRLNLTLESKNAEIFRLKERIVELEEQLKHSQTSSAESAKLQQQIQNLKKQLETTQASYKAEQTEKGQLVIELRTKEKYITNLEQEVLKLEAELNNRANEIQRLQKQLQQEKERTKQAINEKNAEIQKVRDEHLAINQKHLKEKDQLTQEMLKLTKDLYEAQTGSGKRNIDEQVLKEKIAKLEQDIKQVEDINTQKITELQNKEQEYERVLDLLRREQEKNNKLQNEYNLLSQNFEEQENRIAHLMQEIQKLQNEHTEQINQLNGQINTLTEEKNTLEERLQAALEEQERLTLLIQEKEQKLNQKLSKEGADGELTEQINTLKVQIANLKKQLTDEQNSYQDFQQELHRANEQLTQAQTEKQQLQETNTQLKSDFNEVNNRILYLEDELKLARQEKDQLTNQHQSEIFNIKQQKQDLIQKINQINNEVSTLASDKIQLENELANLRDEYHDKDEELEVAVKELDRLKAAGTVKKEKELLVKIDALNADKNALHKQISNCNVALDEKDERINHLNAESLRLQEEINRLNREQGSEGAYQKRQQELESQITDLTEALASYKEGYKNLNEENESLQGQLREEAQRRAVPDKEMHLENEKLQKEKKELEEEQEELHSIIANQNGQIAGLGHAYQSKILEKNEKIKELKSEIKENKAPQGNGGDGKILGTVPPMLAGGAGGLDLQTLPAKQKALDTNIYRLQSEIQDLRNKNIQLDKSNKLKPIFGLSGIGIVVGIGVGILIGGPVVLPIILGACVGGMIGAVGGKFVSGNMIEDEKANNIMKITARQQDIQGMQQQRFKLAEAVNAMQSPVYTQNANSKNLYANEMKYINSSRGMVR